MLTLAPELCGADSVIRACTERGIIAAAGHTAASWTDMDRARQSGLRHVVHTFNAMKPLHHREPGASGAALLMDDLFAELICDGIHVVPEVVRLYHRVKPQTKRILVSDALAAAGAADGDYQLGSMTVTVRADEARLADGTLAGSVLTLDRALRNYVSFTGCTFEEALLAVTANPAALLADDSRGNIKKNRRADVVVLNRELEVQATVIGGRLAYLKSI
jgi:N-acetylglucosamine-6-phosphate deacetylase